MKCMTADSSFVRGPEDLSLVLRECILKFELVVIHRPSYYQGRVSKGVGLETLNTYIMESVGFPETSTLIPIFRYLEVYPPNRT